MNVRVLLAPYDSGRRNERMGRGPAHLLDRAIRPLAKAQGHTLDVVDIAIPGDFQAEIQTAFAVCRAVAEEVRESLRAGWFPLVLSGNCNAAVGGWSGCGCSETGLIWFDAHGEATTPQTTTSGFLDGMGISIATGQCWQGLVRAIPGFEPIPGERIVLVGARDLEPAEDALLDRVGVRRIARAEDLSAAAPPSVDGVYVHFDLDALDPAEAVANQWATPGGLSVASVAKAIGDLRQVTRIRAAGIASYDPEADGDGRGARAAAAILGALFV